MSVSVCVCCHCVSRLCVMMSTIASVSVCVVCHCVCVKSNCVCVCVLCVCVSAPPYVGTCFGEIQVRVIPRLLHHAVGRKFKLRRQKVLCAHAS